jgi:hypothetical protein
MIGVSAYLKINNKKKIKIILGCPALGISVGFLKQRETAYSIRRRGLKPLPLP